MLVMELLLQSVNSYGRVQGLLLKNLGFNMSEKITIFWLVLFLFPDICSKKLSFM
jgi:hypothetical protein